MQGTATLRYRFGAEPERKIRARGKPVSGSAVGSGSAAGPDSAELGPGASGSWAPPMMRPKKNWDEWPLLLINLKCIGFDWAKVLLIR